MEPLRIFPRFKRPERLDVFHADGLEWDRYLCLTALQGLVNRTKPRIYQVVGNWDQHWLDYYKKRFGVEYETVQDPMSLVKQYQYEVSGVVVYDETVRDTANLAITISGLESLLPVSQRLLPEMEKLGLEKRVDLRGRFSERLDVYRWAKDNLLSRCSRHILGSLCTGRRKNWMQGRKPIVDYLVANRSFVYHLSSARRDREENALLDEILEEAGGPGVIMGWHCARDQEKEYVSRAARKGFFVLCSASSPNLTVHGGIPRRREIYSQREPRPVERVEQKVYLSLYMTDGDAIWAMNNLQSLNWSSKNRGKLPFNWGLLPLLYEVAPGMLEYYYETKTDNDYFVCPSSGAAYTYSFLHGDWYLEFSRRYMHLTGQTTANMVNWDTNYWWREVENPEAIYREKRMLGALGLVCGLGGSVFAKSYPQGTPKIHAALVLHVEEDCAEKIRTLVERIKTRPLFIFAFVQIGSGVYDHLVEQLSSLPDEVEIVHMDTFMMTLREAARRGLVSEDLYPDKRALEDVMLREPGKREKEAAKRLLSKLSQICSLPTDEMVRELNLGNWHLLAAQEPSTVEKAMEKWREDNEGYMPYDTKSPADALAYNLFYTSWAFIRACLNEKGVYANHMDSCLDEYVNLFPERDPSALIELWEIWHNWYQTRPNLEKVVDLVRRVDRHAQQEGS